jgi:hypothetical protein
VIGELQRQIIVEILVSTGPVSKKGHHVADQPHPDKGTGSFLLLQENKVPEESMVTTMQMLECNLASINEHIRKVFVVSPAKRKKKT